MVPPAASTPLQEPVRVVLPAWVDPAAAARSLAAAHPHLVWRDRSRAETDRVDFVGVAGPDDVLVRGTEPLDRLMAALRARLPAARVASRHLGWWGWLGYEAGAAELGLAPPEDGDGEDEPPSAAFLFAATGVELDHDRRLVTAVGLPGHEDAVAALVRRLRSLPGDPAPVPDAPPATGWSWRHDRDPYIDLVQDCRRAIAAGDAYQLCLTNRITVRLPQAPDPFDVHLRLRDAAPVPAGGVLRIGDRALVSASPETFLTVDAGGRARSSPIKGTRPRGADPAADRALADELRGSEKERAENVMIVDLVRNDLARVARVGSVEVTRLFDVESYPALHQLVSTVEAQLAGEPLDAVRALFPAGSMTGAPKHAAMRILQRLEDGPRGVYAGATGRIAVDGTIDLAVVIRSVVLHGTTATIGTGGGITILSDPAAEWAEVELKARPLLAALGAAVR